MDTFTVLPDVFDTLKDVFSCKKPEETKEPTHEQFRQDPEPHKITVYDYHPGITIDTTDTY